MSPTNLVTPEKAEPELYGTLKLQAFLFYTVIRVKPRDGYTHTSKKFSIKKPDTFQEKIIY